ncbi:MAG: hypothetical protein QOJ79_2619 [Actinomycetota bacterium]|nr:hypothetical protein [Actinomycetota bacterium]
MSPTVLPYSETWPALFEEEAVQLRDALRPWLVDGIHHIGSTAVPGLAAKPSLDMMAGVADLDVARNAIPVLAGLGYEHSDHRPHEALWFYKQPGADYSARTHQLHLTRPDSDLWRERLAFRDALRGDPQLRAEYEALKRALASDGAAVDDYASGKRPFVTAVLERRGIYLG